MSAYEVIETPQTAGGDEFGVYSTDIRRETDAKPMKFVGSPLTTSLSTEEAIAALLGQASTVVERNALILMLSDNPEGPHQFRVGLRRLRSILKTARRVLTRSALRPVETWARDLGHAASTWRDADVLVDDIVKPALAAGAAPTGGAALLETLDAAREDARAQARDAIRMLGPTGFLNALAELVAKRRWRIDAFDSASEKAAKAQRKTLTQPARRHAGRALDRAWREAAEWGDRLDALTIDERHEMRKALKTLRYTVDSYAPLYDDDPEKTAAFAKELRRLQNVFGYLNDVAMAEALVAGAPAERRLATGAILAWHADRAAKAWEKAQRRWRGLEQAPRFW